MGPFDRFNDRAKRVLALAQDEAVRFGHNYIGPEHLLLGLVREGEGAAARTLGSLGVELAKVRQTIEFQIGRGESTPPNEITLSPRTKKIIEHAVDEARRLGHSQVGTEHLLLGIVREGDTVAQKVLESLGVTLEKVRHQMIATLGQAASQRASRPDPAQVPPGAQKLRKVLEAIRSAKEAAMEAQQYELASELRQKERALQETLTAAMGDSMVTAAASPGPPTSGRTGGPFNRFDDRAKRIIALAQNEAIRLRHNYIGTEHLLAGIMCDGAGIGAKALDELGADINKVRTSIEFIIGQGNEETAPTDITLSPRTKKILELAVDEADQRGHAYVGSAHLLLGLVREGQGIASGILESLGISLDSVRQRVLVLMERGS